MIHAFVAIAVLAVGLSHVAVAHAQTLTFDRPAAQGPGTPGYMVISDPTIQPFLTDGYPSSLGITASIDLQGNGRPDIVACHTTNPAHPPPNDVPCRVLRPQPDGSVVDVTRQLFGQDALPSVTWPREIVSGDFNRDGRQDIFVADFGYDAPPWPGDTNVLLISNADGTYSDRSSTLPQVPDAPHSACVGDINGDGYLDVYVGNIPSMDTRVGPYFLMGLGDGTFTQKTTGLPPSIRTLEELFFSSLLVDVDQDGYADLVLGTAPTNGYFHSIVLFNDGTGDFTVRPRLALPEGPLAVGNFIVVDVASLDINRDGRPDLILLSSAGLTDTGIGLQVLINQAGGTFVDESATRLLPQTDHLDGPWYPFVHFADFNGDGWEDFYLDTHFHGNASLYPLVWLNNGNGTWTPVATGALPPGFGFGVIHGVDFDADGRPDFMRIGGVAGGNPPDIGYSSYLNRTPRTVPSAPLIAAATAHNARAAITFTAPLASGTSAITGYTATCSPGNVHNSGAASPISVTSLTNGTHYSCAVTATNLAGISMPSGTAIVTPFLLPFTDDPVIAGSTPIKASHITELRARIDAARVISGLAAYAWTDPSLTAGSSGIAAAHIMDLRTSLAQVYVVAGLTTPTFTDASLIGVAVKAIHIAEVRAAVAAIE